MVTQKVFYELVVVLCYDYQMAGTSTTSYCHNLLPGNDSSLSSLSLHRLPRIMCLAEFIKRARDLQIQH